MQCTAANRQEEIAMRKCIRCECGYLEFYLDDTAKMNMKETT